MSVEPAILETIHRDQLSQRLPYVVRVPVPRSGLTRMLDAMHAWARGASGNGYAASPFRDFSDPWNPSGCFRWHFRNAEAARQFAVKFSGKLIRP